MKMVNFPVWSSVSMNSIRPWLRALGAMALVVFALGRTASASAGNIYIAQSATGGATGASCANAQPVTFFNAGGNWGSGASQIGAGTTVHLCGTISSSLSANGSGAAGSPVTILFESGAKISAPFCAGDSCINLSGRSWITVDGGTSCGYVNGQSVACNGTIESTANGTSLANQVAHNTAIDADGTSNVEIRNLLIQNLYVHTGNTDQTAVGPDGCVVYYNANSLSIHNLTGHDLHWCFAGGGNNLSIYNNEVYNVDHAVSGGNETSGTTYTNISIYGNYFHDYAVWDVGNSANHPYHHDGIQFWGLSTGGGTSGNNGVVTNLKIYDNLFAGDMGQWHTGQIYLMDSINNAYVYNNVVIGSLSTAQPVYALIRIDGTAGDNSQGPISVLNNTVVGNNPGGYCVWGTVQNQFSVKNNVVLGCQTLIELDNTTLASGGLENNVYQGGGFSWNTQGTSSLATWQGESGGDTTSKLVASAGVSATGQPQAGAAVIGAALNLTSVGISTLDADRSGDLRPSTGSWDAGAYEFGTSATQPAAPTNLTATVQ